MSTASDAGSPDLAGSSLPREWFERQPLDVAHDLLGMVLTHVSVDGAVTLRVSEVEAYHGEHDPGSHAFRGRSARNEVMFGPPGYLYTYRHLGLHTCVNVVCGPVGHAAAVLLRAGEVTRGADLARSRRRAAGTLTHERDLARGPARLTVALGITMADLGADLLTPDGGFRLAPGDGLASARIETGPRVGVSGEGGDGDQFPWRMWIAGDPTVSDFRRASLKRRAAGHNTRENPHGVNPH